jgi:ATP-dependent Clp protease protease subunit
MFTNCVASYGLQDDLRAKAFYVGDDVKTTTRQSARMAVDTKAPGQAPPDLPSLLLDGRICYIGMPLVPSVTELVISELLWLNYANPEKPVYVYINSTGSQSANGEAVGFETEATAILDTMSYIRPDIYTLAIGQAFGNAAMILASGKKGHRFALPHSRIMTCPPRLNRSFGNVSDVMIKANELEKSTDIYVDHLARYTGQDKESLRKDVGRNRYFTPEQAIEYGLIDSVVAPNSDVSMESKDYEAMLRATQARMQSRGGGGSAGAEAA